MSDSDDDCGCTSKNKEINEQDFENVKKSMESTRDSLNQMFDTIQNMSLDFSKFNSLENELKKVSDYIQSGDYAKSMVNEFMKNSDMDMSQIMEFQRTKLNNTPFNIPKQETRNPIGWVYVDENGDQKFSPIKPDDVVSLPVYAD